MTVYCYMELLPFIFFRFLVQSSRIIYLIINMSLLHDHTSIDLFFLGITLAVAALYHVSK